MSILITSISNKRPMVSAFSAAARKIGWKSIGCDLDPHAPAIKDVDIYCSLPPSDSENFGTALLAVVETHGVKLILPTRDGDLLPLVMLTEALTKLGCILPLPSTKTVLLCQDKLTFSYKLKEYDLKWVPTYSKLPIEDMAFFTRPRFGEASNAAHLVKQRDEAMNILEKSTSLLHPFIESPEYSIDLLMDFSGNPVEALTRRRIKIISGESKHTQIEDQPKLRSQAMKLGKLLGLKGHNLLQAFLPEDGDPIFIEANLRFGGASILAIKAGMNSPEFLINMAAGLDPDPSLYEKIKFGLTLRREQVEDVEIDHFS